MSEKLTIENLEKFVDELEEQRKKEGKPKLGVETIHTSWGTIYRIHLGNGGFVDTGEGGLKEFDQAVMRNINNKKS